MATDSSQVVMSMKRRAILEDCSEDLVKFMDLNIMIWARLISARVVSTVEKERIVRSGIMEEQVSNFLALMTRKKNGDFDILVKCLADNNQGHVAEILRQADAANTWPEGQNSVPEETSQSTTLERTHLSEVPSTRRIRHTTKEFYEEKKGESYDTAGDRKGVAMIVNITQGKNQKTGKKWRRKGSEADGENLERLFDDLKYDVESFEDLTLQQFIAAMETVAKKADDENAKSLFVVLMSHGKMKKGEHVIFSSDGWCFYVKDTLKNIFGSKNLQRLAKRPKVFILQACQGDDPDYGVQVYDETEKDAEPGAVSRETRSVASFAHYLIASATQEEFAAHRDTTKGSWFIQEVVSVFREKAATKDITELLMEVRRNIWSRKGEEGSMQTTEDKSTLGKKFYIFPGI